MSAHPNQSSAARTPHVTPQSGVIIPYIAPSGINGWPLVDLVLVSAWCDDPFQGGGSLRLFSSDAKEKVIFTVWHNRRRWYYRFMIGLSAARNRAPDGRHREREQGRECSRACWNCSKSNRCGARPPGGRAGVRELVTCGERGFDLAITPDGPRGPCYVIRDGVIATANSPGWPSFRRHFI